ncbi:D-arabinono-1,4-lactone oxidase [Dactylosporangium fulvum]|uniref:FAD-binding protein n=1 Tax=Dactylosporangium fulvum TaxID=53359 RepID=A0ABY5VZ28_9ACTN|nr:D-arabinono-1,4-lactone oxidase [Dactylosporangium fulvum]UWP82967.1 FAD-binding protein [Dactylosporangium fulvum]
MTSPWANWAGNQTARATRVAHPETQAELGEVLRAAAGEGLRVKAVGSGHSFTPAAATDGLRVELDRMTSLVRVEGDLVTVQAGMPLAKLNATLAAHGLAMPNLGDIDAQTISGALSTGTHGTGAAYGCLPTFIEALELVTADGSVLRCSATEQPELFAAARVNIGALGVLTSVTLRCVPAFVLRADERPAPLADVWSGLDEHIAENDHFEFYWFPYTDRVQMKRNNRVEVSDRPLAGWRRWLDDDFLSNTVFGGACRVGRTFPAVVPAVSRISARALSARTYTALSHDVFCTPRRVRFVEMEYGLPRAALREAFDGLRSVVAGLPFRVQFPVEVRFTAADDIWLSHGHGRDNAYVAIHQFVGAPYEEYFRRFEAITTALGGRPHWGKMHYRDAASLSQAYPRFTDFVAMRDKLDPGRLFANAYTDRILGP